MDPSTQHHDDEEDDDDDDDDEEEEGSDTLHTTLNSGNNHHTKLSGKRTSRGDDDEGDLSRSERKRNREKNRRNALNHRLESLATLLFKIDPSLKAGAKCITPSNSSSNSSNSNSMDQTIMNRVSLIQSAVQTLERIYNENEERKLIIRDLTNGGDVVAAATVAAVGRDDQVCLTAEHDCICSHVVYITNNYASYLFVSVFFC